MKNKVLIKLIIPDIDNSYDIFIPVNETIWKIKKLIIKSITDITNLTLDNESRYILINKTNSRIYMNNEIILNTDIRNSSELILITIKN